jgi:hypothetical protein
MYQPKMEDKYIRQLYFKAKREGRRMTHLLDEAMEEYLKAEPDPQEGVWLGKKWQARALAGTSK